MTVQELLETNRDDILRIAKRHGVRRIRVFGSAVRVLLLVAFVAGCDTTDESDIDFLVETGEETSPWFPAGLVEELSQLLGRPVDVVTEDSLYWLLRRRILTEARPL